MSSQLLINPLVVFFKLRCRNISCGATKGDFCFQFLNLYFDLNYQLRVKELQYVSATLVALDHILCYYGGGS